MAGVKIISGKSYWLGWNLNLFSSYQNYSTGSTNQRTTIGGGSTTGGGVPFGSFPRIAIPQGYFAQNWSIYASDYSGNILVGNNTIEATSVQSGKDQITLVKFTATSTGIAKNINLHIGTGGGGMGQYVIYSDLNGSPYEFLGGTLPVALTSSGTWSKASIIYFPKVETLLFIKIISAVVNYAASLLTQLTTQ